VAVRRTPHGYQSRLRLIRNHTLDSAAGWLLDRMGNATLWPALASEVLRCLDDARGMAWGNYLVLSAYAMTALGYKANYSVPLLRTLHVRFGVLHAIAPLDLSDPTWFTIWLPAYLARATESRAANERFVSVYALCSEHTHRWLANIPQEQHGQVAAWALPPIDVGMLRQAMRRNSMWSGSQVRFAEGVFRSDAPLDAFFLSHLHSQLCQRYQHVCTVHGWYTQTSLALNSDRAAEAASVVLEPDLAVRLWNRQQLGLAYIHAFSRSTRYSYQDAAHFAQSYLLEMQLCEPQANHPYWYIELLQQGLLGDQARWGTARTRTQRQEWLAQAGYRSAHHAQAITPFATTIPGLLAWPRTHQLGRFVYQVQPHMIGVLVPIDSFLAATHYALIAFELARLHGFPMRDMLLLSTKEVWTLLDATAYGLQELPLKGMAPGTSPDERFFQYHTYPLAKHDLDACLRFFLHGAPVSDQQGTLQPLDGKPIQHLLACIDAGSLITLARR
jgi:hypothetical protein